MSKNGVPQEQLDALKRLFDIINKQLLILFKQQMVLILIVT